MQHSTPQDIQEEVIPVTDTVIERFQSAILHAQESNEVLGGWGPKGRYKRLLTLRIRNGQPWGAPLHAFVAPAPQRQCHDAPRLEHKLHCVDKHRLREKKLPGSLEGAH